MLKRFSERWHVEKLATTSHSQHDPNNHGGRTTKKG